ncbi:MAG: CHAT domain-containing protein [Saprospiraceae bacterium]
MRIENGKLLNTIKLDRFFHEISGQVKSVRFFYLLFLIVIFPLSIINCQNSQKFDKAKRAMEKGSFLEAFLYANQAKPILSENHNLIETYQTSVEYLNVVEQFSNRIEQPLEKQLFYQLEFESYELMLEICEQLFHKTNDKKYFDKAFSLAEKQRNLLLFNTLGFNKNNLSDSLKTIEGKYLSDISALNNKLKLQKQHFPEWKNGDFIYRLEQERDSIQTKYEQFLEEHQPKFPAAAIDSKTLQQNLKNNEAFIIYFYGKKAIYTFVITESEQSFFKIKTNKIPAEINEMIFSVIQNLHSAKETEAIHHLHELYKILFQPIESKLGNRTKLQIVADGSLSVLPFDALLSKKVKNWDFDFKKLSFLIYDYQITHQHSATTFVQQKTSNKILKNPTISVFAPNFHNTKIDNRQLNELKQSKFLIKNLQSDWNGSFFKDKKATLVNFKNLQNINILHFATHTLVDDEAVLNSKIILADKPLFLKDLYQINLDANLAILGSCRTGSGQYQVGVGRVGMAYGFHLAGVNSLIYSLWEVDETATNRLLLAFYDNLQKGLSKDDALHQAKINYLQFANEVTADPYYWSGFVLQGETSGFEFRNEKTLISLIIGIFMILIIAYLRRFFS